MRITEKKLPEGKIVLEARATASEVEAAFDSAQELFLAGTGVRFSGGKTPSQIAAEKLGINDLDSIVSSSAMEALIPYAVDKSGLAPAYPPKLLSAEPLLRGRETRFSLEVQPKTAYELCSYEPVAINVPPFAVDEGEIERQVEELVGNVTVLRDAGDLRTELREKLIAQSRARYDAYCRQIATEQLAQRLKGGIPDEAYDAMRKNLMQGLRRQLDLQGIAIDDYVEQQGGRQQFEMKLMMQARSMLTEGFALDSFFAHEKLKLEEEDYLLAAGELVPWALPTQTKSHLEKTGRKHVLREVAERRKAAAYLLEHAVIKEMR